MLLLALFIPPHSTAVQRLQKFSKMQLHQVAARSFSYTVHDGSLQADRHRRGDYVTAFHLLAPFFPGLAGVAVM